MRKYTDEEDCFLRDNYLTIPTKRMSKILKRSESSARQRLHLLGLKVPADIAAKFKAENQLQPGNVPMNKGKKLKDYCTPDAIAAMQTTQFNKGNEPHNTKYDGAISLRYDNRKVPMYHIRLSKAKWEYLHRFNYQKFIGEIPKGGVVIFKDGNTLNCHPFNLQLITKKENVLRNSIQRYPQELQQVIKLTAKLKKKIKNYGKE